MKPKPNATQISGLTLVRDFRDLSHRILHYANRGFLRIDFLREISKIILESSGCDAVELHLKEHGKYYRCVSTRRPQPAFEVETQPEVNDETTPAGRTDSALRRLRREVVNGQLDPASPFVTKNGSFWIGDAENAITFHAASAGHYQSLAFIPLITNGGIQERIGLVELKSAQQNFFAEDEIEFYEGIAQILGMALTHRRTQVDLRERVKELTCLYGIAQLAEQPDMPLNELLLHIVTFLPPAWLYPESALARIIVDGRSYTTPGFHQGRHKLTADIMVNGERRGAVEVVYADEKPELDEGPFLKEERALIDAVAKELALIIERRKAEEDKLNLQDQLLHADRLATIGQLAAGVAHELNEPLGNILGFAQLAQKSAGLPEQTAKDIDKIVAASLHAREVIKKLLIFARQMPPTKTQVNLNKIVEESLYFLESRCVKQGIQLFREFAPGLPDITADPTQLQQVLVNLIVNAIQAMPQGGRLTVTTRAGNGDVFLVVEDTGTGMTEEVKVKLFTPFFTTKEVGQGTGLGLPVVHGIVTSHGGSIDVESEIGHGTRFTIKLPIREPQENEESNYV